MPTLDCRPCTDSPALASARRMELDISRSSAIHLGRTAVEAIERGHYDGPDGRPRDWQALIAAAVAQRVSIPPDAPLPTAECAREQTTREETTRVEVANETTMAASLRLTMAGHRPLALNFANGVQPGGGFLEGSRAQEEGLCRSSGLYATLTGDAMYAAHRRRPTPDSTEWAILSPHVPVFRRDEGTSLDAPWLLDVITCAAPVASRVGQPLAGDLLAKRIHRVLAIAQAYRYRTLVLGAWGCGAFGNDPKRTAKDFRMALEGRFAGAFSDVVFAITDWSAERRFLRPFRDTFNL